MTCIVKLQEQKHLLGFISSQENSQVKTHECDVCHLPFNSFVKCVLFGLPTLQQQVNSCGGETRGYDEITDITFAGQSLVDIILLNYLQLVIPETVCFFLYYYSTLPIFSQFHINVTGKNFVVPSEKYVIREVTQRNP